MNDPGAYAGYISSSPSIWLKDWAVLADESELKAKSSLQPRAPALLLTVGEYDAKPLRSVPGYSRFAAEIR
jgi:predicted alpha/beta superfamily hydrolase